MLPISTKDPVRFTPPSLEGRDDAPVFLLKVPTMRERLALSAAIAEEGVSIPSNSEMATALRDAIAEHVVDEQQPELLGFVDEFAAAVDAGGNLEPELSGKIDEIVNTLRRYHRPLARIGAAREEYLGVLFMVRSAFMIVGIEGKDAPAVERRGGRLTERCIDAIEDRYGRGTVISVGIKCQELTNPTEDDAKNSESPPQSPSGPATSKGAKPPRTAPNGKSSASAI